MKNTHQQSWLYRQAWVLAALYFGGCVWLTGCSGPANPAGPAQMAAQLQASERKNLLQEKMLAQIAQATITGYKDYLVGPEDLLVVSVFGIEDMEKDVRVNGQGEISMPLVGPVKVSDLSVQDIERRLAQLYREGDYIKMPQVTVQVKEYRHQRVMITGGVMAPGSYELIGPRTLLEVMGKAGGLSEKAGETVQVIRAQSASAGRKGSKADQPFSPGTETIVIDLNRLLTRGELALNLPIKNGDVIHVPFAKSAFVLGAVTSPKNVPVKDNLTATQAVALAGGQHILLSSNRVTIVRLNDKGEPITLELDLGKVTSGQEADIPLQGNDIVFVQESGIRRFLFDFRSLMPGSYSVGSTAAF